MEKEGGFDLVIKPVEYAASLDQQDAATSTSCSRLVRAGRPRRRTPTTSSAPPAARTWPATGAPRSTSPHRRPLRTPTRHNVSCTATSSRSCSRRPLIYMYRQRNSHGVTKKLTRHPGLRGRRDPAAAGSPGSPAFGGRTRARGGGVRRCCKVGAALVVVVPRQRRRLRRRPRDAGRPGDRARRRGPRPGGDRGDPAPVPARPAAARAVRPLAWLAVQGDLGQSIAASSRSGTRS